MLEVEGSNKGGSRGTQSGREKKGGEFATDLRPVTGRLWMGEPLPTTLTDIK
jgi:hypothetical protein